MNSKINFLRIGLFLICFSIIPNFAYAGFETITNPKLVYPSDSFSPADGGNGWVLGYDDDGNPILNVLGNDPDNPILYRGCACDECSSTDKPEVCDWSPEGGGIGAIPKDTRGEDIQAHGSGIMSVKNNDGTYTYYRYGGDKGNGGWGSTTNNCYSSRDLSIWKFEGVNFSVDPSGATRHWDGASSGCDNYNSCAQFNDVWGSSGTDVFAVGDGGKILHYDGSRWSSMTSGTPYWLSDVWGSSSLSNGKADDVFAVGDGGTILHYDGNSDGIWSSMTSGWEDDFHVINGVWGSSGTDVFAVGGPLLWAGGKILHYDGSSWSSMDTTYHLIDVWGSSGTDVFAVGVNGTILHYDGSSWSSMTSGTTNHLRGVWGSSSNDVFAVGGYKDAAEQEHGFILHYEDNVWVKVHDTDQILRSVWGSSGTDVFAVGDGGTILHYDGSTTCTSGSDWCPMISSEYQPGLAMGLSNHHLLGVWGSSGSNVFACGDADTILQYNEENNVTKWRMKLALGIFGLGILNNYNDKETNENKKYLLYASVDYGLGMLDRTVVATCNTPTGLFKVDHSLDATIAPAYIDEDEQKNAYSLDALDETDEANNIKRHVLVIRKLVRDNVQTSSTYGYYTTYDETFNNNLGEIKIITMQYDSRLPSDPCPQYPDYCGENYVLMKKGDFYYIVSSRYSVWSPNQNGYIKGESSLAALNQGGLPAVQIDEYGTATNKNWSWTPLTDNTKDVCTFYSQVTNVFKLPDSNNYIYAGNRWTNRCLPDTTNVSNNHDYDMGYATYVWLPLKFDTEGKMWLDWYENWKVDAQARKFEFDSDSDGTSYDGDGSGITGDNSCTTGTTFRCDDNCPYTPNGPDLGTCTAGNIGINCHIDNDCNGGFCSKNQEDADADGFGDVCDNCPNTANANQSDGDADGTGDVCDNCPTTCNTQQLDADGDTLGDVCDTTPGCGGCGPPCEQPC